VRQKSLKSPKEPYKRALPRRPYTRAKLSTSSCAYLVGAQERAKHEAAEKENLARELAASKNVNALVEKQKHDAVRAGWEEEEEEEFIIRRGSLNQAQTSKDLKRRGGRVSVGEREREKRESARARLLLAGLFSRAHLPIVGLFSRAFLLENGRRCGARRRARGCL